MGARSTGCSARFGNSLTPVIASARVAMPAERACQVAASRRSSAPDRKASTIPPCASIAVNWAHAAWASSSVSRSTYQEPPAGSITPATDDSSSSTAWVLRAIRRGERVGEADRRVEGCTVTASAPPTPAPKQASVVRSMFTHGSRRVIIADEVTACCACGACAAPETSRTRAHSRRAARNLAIVRNWSAVAA